jgi:MFS family permease
MRRLLILVGASVLVDLAFYAAITPLLPVYADRFELSKTGAGVLTGAYAAGALLGALPSGWLAVRFGARRTVVIGLALMSIASLGFAFGSTVGALDAMRFLQGVGGACSWAGGLGWLVSSAPAERRGRLIGSAMSAALGGLLLGPVVGAVARGVGPKAPFTAIAVLGAVLMVAALRMPAPPASVRVERPLTRALRARPVRIGMTLVTVLALVFGTLDVLVPLRLDRLGATGLGIAATFFVASAIEAVAQVYVGRAADRHGRGLPLRIGLAGTVAFLLLLPLPGVAVVLALLTIAGSVVCGSTNTPAMALLSDGIDATGLDQGFGFALVNLTWATGQVLGAIGGGALARATSDAVAYVLLAAVCLATLAVMARAAAAPREAAARSR